MEVSCEDVLMFALEHEMPRAVKESLAICQQQLKAMNLLTQARLVLATLPVAVLGTCSPASFISGELLMVYSKLLRGLLFVRANWKVSTGFQHFALTLVKLEKVILMHLICSDTHCSTIEEHLTEVFLPDTQECLERAKNDRFKTVLKREINSFTEVVKRLLNNDEAKLKYIQQTMWHDFGNDFWRDLENNLLLYIKSVKNSFPPLKLDKLAHQDCSETDNPAIQTLKVKTIQQEPILEDDILLFLSTISKEKHLLPQDLVQTKTSSFACENSTVTNKNNNVNSSSFYGNSRKKSQNNSKSRPRAGVLKDCTNTCNLKTEFQEKKRKHHSAFSPKDLKPAKRPKLFSATDALQLLLCSDSESEISPAKGVLPNSEDTTVSVDSKKTLFKFQESKTNLEQSEILPETQIEFKNCSQDNATLPSKTSQNTALRLDQKTKKESEHSKQNTIHRSRPITRSLQKLFKNKPLLHRPNVNSSPKVSRKAREGLSMSLRPLSRRQLQFSGKNVESRPPINNEELLCEPLNTSGEATLKELTVVACKLPQTILDKHSVDKTIGVSEAIDFQLETMDAVSPIANSGECVDESDCESDISLNLSLNVNYPDFDLLPIQQAYYSRVNDWSQPTEA